MRKHERSILYAFPLMSLVTGCAASESAARGLPTSGRPIGYATPSTTAARSDAGAAAPAPSRDRFETVPTNPFVMAQYDPFSTFAADVDTASYDIFVRDIEDELLPAPDSVRVEEYINSFDYDYPAPKPGADIPFMIDLAAAAHPIRDRLVQLRVGIQAADPPVFERLQTHLVFLVDTSGSMQDEDKLPYAQLVIRHALESLGATDLVSIVSYAGDTAVRLPPTTVGTGRRAILAAVDGLRSGGGTNGASGIHLAYAQAEAAFIRGGFNHVILCTDGDFNIGVTNTDELVALIEQKRETGVTLTALGFGTGNLNDAMMERVTNAGNGVYSVITSAEHAQRYAEQDLLKTAHFVAKDMKIQVEFNPEFVSAYRLVGYDNRLLMTDQFRQDAVDAGEVGAGLRVTALYEVVLTGDSIPMPESAEPVRDGEPVEGVREIDSSDWVEVRVRWKELSASADDPAGEVSLGLTPLAISTTFDPLLDADLAWSSALAAFAEILRESPFASRDELARIGEIVRMQATRDEERSRFAAYFEVARGLLSR